jgi:uncharacterized protein YecT (DUF1311 family)
MRLFLVTLAFTAPLLTTAARALDCNNPPDQTTMNQCADQEFKKADTELNHTYRQIEARLKDDAGSKKLLVAAQRAWVAFRDAECNFQGGPPDEAGSIYPMVVASCRSALTNARVGDFKGYLSCEEGDANCPLPPAQ